MQTAISDLSIFPAEHDSAALHAGPRPAPTGLEVRSSENPDCVRPTRPDIGWGRFNCFRHRHTPTNRPKVVLFCSFPFGNAALRHIVERRDELGITITGIVTDDVLDSKARISKKKRTWQYLSVEKTRQCFQEVVDLALNNEIDLFTGSIKSSFFIEKLLPRWAPDLILMYGFGQMIPASIYDYPRFGMVNLHPSDIGRGLYKGADPFGDMERDHASYAMVTAHEVTEELDSGAIIAATERIPIPRFFSTNQADLMRTFGRIIPAGNRLAEQIVVSAVRKYHTH